MPRCATERRNDQCLVVPTTLVVSGLSESSQDVIVDPDRNPGFAGRDLDWGTAFALNEVVFSFRELASYCTCSLGLASRAEISRAATPRQMKTTPSDLGRPAGQAMSVREQPERGDRALARAVRMSHQGE